MRTLTEEERTLRAITLVRQQRRKQKKREILRPLAIQAHVDKKNEIGSRET
jgi:hypothetical protein